MGKTKAQKAAEAAAKAAAAGAGDTAVESAKPQKNQASVFDKNGAFIRTYTLAEHGEKYEEYAEEFASKEAGRTVK